MRSLCLFALLVLLVGGCVSKPLVLASLAKPPVTDKLRIYYKVISDGEPQGGWHKTEEEVEAATLPLIAKALDGSGVCDLVGAAELKLVLREQAPLGWRWLADDLALARQVGRALHADYGILMERHRSNVAAVRYILVNVHTGSTFEARSLLFMGSGAKQSNKDISKKTWKKLYQMARKDLFAAAVRKGRGELVAAPSSSVVRLVEATPVEDLPESPAARGDLPTLAVYDFDADESMRTAAIILADALREELLKIGKVQLVNRENIRQVLQEMAVSQLGLSDDAKAVEIGKALTSSQIVTGHIGALGNSSVLQVKRVNVESLQTRYVGSSRSPRGAEDQLFDKIPSLAQEMSLGL